MDTNKREVMETPLSLCELYNAAKDLAKGKVPGPNGILLEFFLLNWESIGETLLCAVLKGVEDGKLHSRFTKGLLVLLAKHGDLKYLINYRLLTLLNLIYKIVAKAY